MKKNFIFIFALIFLLSVSSVNAADYSAVIVKDPFALAKINISGLINNPSLASIYKGEIKKSLDSVFEAFEKKTGISFMRDIGDIGICFSSRIDFNAPGPNGVYFFISGTFQADKLFTVLKNESETAGLISIKERAGLKVIEFKKNPFKAVILNENFIIIATEDIIEKIAGGKFETAGLIKEEQDKFVNSHIYVRAILNEDIKKTILTDEFIMSLPAALKRPALNLNSFEVSSYSLDFILNFKFNDFSTASEFKKILDSFKNESIAEIVKKINEIEKKIKNSESIFEIISTESANLKTGYVLINEVLKMFEFESNGDMVKVNFKMPPEYAQIFTPEMTPFIVAGAGIVAAVAIPNFQKARERAREKAGKMNKNIIDETEDGK